MKLEGKNAVGEALKAGVTIDRLVVQKGLTDKAANAIIAEAKARDIKILFRDKEALDRESKDGRHQGFVADVTDYKYAELADILSGEPSLALILDGIEDPHNLGSILRVAECAGADGVVIPRHRAASVNETVIKVSAGAANHVRVAKVANVNAAIEECKAKGMWVYALDAEGDDLYSADLSGPVALVVGGEGKGVTPLTLKLCDGVLKIPMRGKLGSLNASVAAGIASFYKLQCENGKLQTGGDVAAAKIDTKDIFVKARNKAGLDFAAAAKAARVGKKSLEMFERGYKFPTYKTFVKLQQVLGISDEQYALARLEFEKNKLNQI